MGEFDTGRDKPSGIVHAFDTGRDKFDTGRDKPVPYGGSMASGAF